MYNMTNLDMLTYELLLYKCGSNLLMQVKPLENKVSDLKNSSAVNMKSLLHLFIPSYISHQFINI